MKKIIYVASIATGEYDDYDENDVFCSFDKLKVEKWINKFNNIITNNKNRISEFDNDNDDKTPYLYEYIINREPSALMKEISFEK